MFKKDVRMEVNKAIAYLKPAIRDDETESAIKLSHEDSPVLKEFDDDLLVAYLVDTGNEFTYVQYRHLEAESVTESELHDLALQNLAELALDNLRIALYPDIYAVLMGGNFGASLILLDQLWE